VAQISGEPGGARKKDSQRSSLSMLTGRWTRLSHLFYGSNLSFSAGDAAGA
jgi:hypothetical protein